MTAPLKKKIAVAFLLLLLIPVFSACDIFQEEEEEERFYLDIALDNPYGVETFKPGPGRYIYDEDAVAELEFAEAEGWNFLGWQGDDGDEVAEEDDGEYSLVMNEDKSIKAALNLKEFKPLDIDFDGIDTLSYADREDIEGVPHNISYVRLKFNNALNENNEIEAVIRPENDEEENNEEENEEEENNNNEEEAIEPDEIEVQDNIITVSLTDWRDRFFVDEEEDEHLEFAQEYEMVVDEATSGDNIFDVENREIDEEIKASFVVEEPYPGSPDDVNLKVENDTIELSWHRSRKNAKIDIDEFVEDYEIYKSEERDDLIDADEIDEDEVEIIEFNIEDPQDKKVLRYEDEDVDLAEEDYFYRIKAINELGNESRLSELAGTE